MAEATTAGHEPTLRDWERLAQRSGPKISLWLAAAALFAGVMLAVCPVRNGWPILTAVSALVLTLVVFLLGWLAGARVFAHSCESFRRGHRTFRLRYIVPLTILAITGLGLIGSRYWWAFGPVVALVGHRKGTQRAWWAAVAALAFVFRSGHFGVRIAESDGVALAKAKDAINESIGRWQRQR